MITRCFPTSTVVHRINIEVSLPELQDLINEGGHAIKTCESAEHVKRLGSLITALAQYYEQIKPQEI